MQTGKSIHYRELLDRVRNHTKKLGVRVLLTTEIHRLSDLDLPLLTSSIERAVLKCGRKSGDSNTTLRVVKNRATNKDLPLGSFIMSYEAIPDIGLRVFDELPIDDTEELKNE